MLRHLEPVARVVVNGGAIAVSLGVFGYCWCRGGLLKLKDRLS